MGCLFNLCIREKKKSFTKKKVLKFTNSKKKKKKKNYTQHTNTLDPTVHGLNETLIVFIGYVDQFLILRVGGIILSINF